MNILKMILVSVLCFWGSAYCQDTRTEDIMKYLKNSQYTEAKKQADQLITEDKYKNDARVWFYRAIVYNSIYELRTKGDTTSLITAFDSYSKALEYDKEKKFNTEVIKSLGVLANQFVYEGVELFNSKDYTRALRYFEKNLEIGRYPAINQIDTVIMYNAAISAEKTGDFAKAVLYYEELIKLNFGGVNVYNDLAKLLKDMGNEQKFIQCAETGIRSYPGECFSLYSEIVNYYLEKGDYPLALSYSEKALESYPESAGLHFVKASINEQNGKTDIAEQEYKKTIELDSSFVDGYFNLGSLYYNKGVDLLKKAMNKDEKNKADEFYKKALEMYEKVYILTPDNQETIKLLANLYGYLGMTDKQKEMQGKIN
jgi:tetratricopeptide (TPR) repeat protein